MIESWPYVLSAGILGLALGSFLNVCSLRWPEDQSVIRPPSRCPGCGERIRWYDNVPVLSWLILRGRCRRCSRRISAQYPLVELATGATWAWMVWTHGPGIEAARMALFVTILIGIAVSDARFYIIPDQFSVGGTILGVGLAALSPALGLASSLLGAAVGFALLWFVAWAGEKAFKKEAMGGGDIKMMAMIGAFLGWTGVLLSLFLGALLGVLIFGPVAYRTGRLVPFGIFLAAGALAASFWGQTLLDWYVGWALGG
jgi:leader peptidase (prepilin peptidase)/N-methyltransferase